MRKIFGISTTLGLLLLVSFTVGAQGAPGNADQQLKAGCRELAHDYPATGHACRAMNGLLAYFSPAGEFQGYTHGPDPKGADDEPFNATVPVGGPAVGNASALPQDKPVQCVAGTAGDYYIQVIYARATDDTDRYSSMAGTIRNLASGANTIVNNAATANGGHVSLRVKCVSGSVEVKNEVLPTSKSSATFATISTDLQNKGYTDTKVKYWVYYDESIPSAPTYAGQGTVLNDETLAASNLNNGNSATKFFAIIYNYPYASTWLHEMGHNLGAVQKGAPHTTDTTTAAHCWDGYDIMCYNDGGPRGSWYSTSYCGSQVFDCNQDDYFNVNPPSGNYLATHWNIGSTYDRYLDFGLDGSPPSLTVNDPQSGVVYGVTGLCSRTSTGVTGSPIYLHNVCVTGSASDAQSGIQKVEFFEDGVLKQTITSSGSFSVSWPATSIKTGASITVKATNNDVLATYTWTYSGVRIIT